MKAEQFHKERRELETRLYKTVDEALRNVCTEGNMLYFINGGWVLRGIEDAQVRAENTSEAEVYHDLPNALAYPRRVPEGHEYKVVGVGLKDDKIMISLFDWESPVPFLLLEKAEVSISLREYIDVLGFIEEGV